MQTDVFPQVSVSGRGANRTATKPLPAPSKVLLGQMLQGVEPYQHAKVSQCSDSQGNDY